MFVELLAPAGSPEALDAAIGEGADAVYLGLKNFNARMRSANFAYSQFEGALKSLHRMGKKIYVTVNTVFEQREADRMYQLLKYLAALGPDGLIVQDFGVVQMVRENFPSLKLHASTQMNIASARGANALSKFGVSRVVLARELTLEEIRDIRADTNAELEVFVHGALCVSASGLCLFSSYLGGKSANRGMCTQACRRFYRRDDEGGYYFSPSDLQLLEKTPELAAAGVSSFKIEGRMKSAEYVGAVVSAYRMVIDAVAGENEEKIQESITQGLKILRNDFARPKTAFYTGPDINWLDPDQAGGTGISLGKLLKVKGAAAGEWRGFINPASDPPAAGDSIRLHKADDSSRVSHKLKLAGKPGKTEPESGGGLWISIPEGFESGDAVYLIQNKSMSKRYIPVIPRELGHFKHMPGRDKAPAVKIAPFLPQGKNAPQSKTSPRDSSRRDGKSAGEGLFPGGLYTAVSRTDDLYIVQSSRPVRVMLSYTRKTAAYLLADDKPPLPFKPAEIILVLDPYFPQSMEILAGEINRLMGKGYYQFVVNNPGHFSLFRGQDKQAEFLQRAGMGRQTSPDKPALIAGPYLYIFNQWAQSLVAAMGAGFFISPLENNRQNFEKTFPPGGNCRAAAFVTVFAWPVLFRIRADLGGIYKFDDFYDSRDERFRLLNNREDGSQVIPEKPFSIVDKIPFLEEAGFSRFILDLSGPPLKKSDFRDLMRSVKDGVPLPDISRFNWKDGFFSAEAPVTRADKAR
ncbi:MAG: U32 family peptidase [Treponema sp.]|jgi:putative protease|nr:U32 family peptidase [Treponema sp.]